MKILSIITLLALAQAQTYAQAPSAETMTATAYQLLGTTAEQDAAVISLVEIGIPAIPYIAGFLSDKDTSVKNAAWRVVNGVGFEPVVSFYITQLGSNDATLRLEATKVLGQTVKKYYGYTADNDDAVKRAEIVEKWTAWLADHHAANAAP